MPNRRRRGINAFHRVAPPTFVASYGPATSSATATQTASITVAIGDVLVLTASSNTSTWTPATPTGGTSVTWTQKVNHGSTSGQSNQITWVSNTMTTAQTFTGSVTFSGSGGGSSIWHALRFSNFGGIGATATSGNAGSVPSLALTTTLDNSAVIMAIDDFNHISGTSRVYLTSGVGSFTETHYELGANATFYYGYYANVGIFATHTYGLSAPSGQVPAVNLLEVWGK